MKIGKFTAMITFPLIIHLVVNLKLTQQTNCESFISGLFKLITKYLVIL